MDLDNIKKTWQETEIKPTIDECKIQKMLDNKGQGAFERLIKYDKLFLWLLIPCFFAGILFFYMHYIPGTIYFIMMIYSFFWQRRKLKFMGAVNLSEMGILEVSKAITKYKKTILYEIMIGVVCLVVFFVPYLYFGMPGFLGKAFGNDSEHVRSFLDTTHLIVMFAVMIITTVAFSFILYKYMYFNNIKQIQESIKEIEYFEKDNND
ncbi:hypothetical protein D0T84_05645 [Dysgonomonas sp. 521]|uniref:hypothetical protein n=1 Tax=Dysgonomonas sp. 521 TaxID=2302932 RepID=UPI0013D106B6|nr:hypothetical protein [Dysgonomonas sp. 521]NDV94403.1 hypothetical protein [Dysgonomonas sp. 521]